MVNNADVYNSFDYRCGQRWAKLGKVSSPDALKEVMKRSGGFADDGYRKKSKMNDTKIYRDGDSLPVATENRYSGYIMTRVMEDKVTYALFWVLDVRENWLLVALVRLLLVIPRVLSLRTETNSSNGMSSTWHSVFHALSHLSPTYIWYILTLLLVYRAWIPGALAISHTNMHQGYLMELHRISNVQIDLRPSNG